MRRVTLKNLLAHKRRLASTLLAVVLGVGFLSGVLTLTATLEETFDELFTNANAGVDSYVRADSRLEVDGFVARGRIDASLFDAVAGVDGVAEASVYITGNGRIVNTEGEALGSPGQGPPTLAENWIDQPGLNPYRIVEGRPPATEGEVVINKGAADEGDVALGERVTIQLSRTVGATVVGIATYGEEDSAGGVTYAAFTTEVAEREIAGQAGRVDAIIAAAAPGVPEQELTDRISALLPAGTEAITGEALTTEQLDDIQSQFLSFFNVFLTIFAGIAVAVAVFSIYNTFSIIVSQRAREMALLRALGASRRQVMGSVLAEALAVGVIGSALGIVAGFGIAVGLKAMLAGFGLGLPASGLAFGPRIAVISMLVGVVVTLVAGVAPALKATRIPPIAAIGDVAFERAVASKGRIIVGLVVVALGVGNVLVAVIGKGDNAVLGAGAGAVLTLLGVVVLGPVAAGPVSRLLGSPLPRLKGVTGSLARENAVRNPRRTSGTAAALMVGVGVAALFTVFAASLKTTINEAIDRSFAGDLVVDSGTFGIGGITPELAARTRQVPGVAAVSGLRFGLMEVDGEPKGVAIADPASLGQVFDLGFSAGAGTLGPTDLAVNCDVADDKGWPVGTKLPVRFVDGATATFTVAAHYDNDDIVGNYVLGLSAWEPHSQENLDTFVSVKVAEGTDVDTVRASIKPLVDQLAAGSELQDREEFRTTQSNSINQVLGLVYAMLALAIVISLMGIANTLSLSINERTRELGLLRAVGMARRQVRSSIRWESVIIALFGTLGGVFIGLFFSWALVQAASSEGVQYTLPFGGLIGLVVAGAVAGILAAVRPARRAARLDILQAIQAD
ncbi:MAG: ABC transporter permease [Acidimicrobiia bacterium]